SFYLEDLSKVRQMFDESNVGRGISAYMGVATPRERQDVVQNRSLLAATLAPERIPLTRWPGRGRHLLFLMQQAAVNQAVEELADEGLMAVNGPPGTGKTTLLRDIVARVVLDRAMVLSEFKNPQSAFERTCKMRTGNADSDLYRLDKRLLGHEIVVACANNKAAENISRGIPSSDAVADDFDPPLRYFQSISDAVAGPNDNIQDGKTWGLAAAVLGNAGNREAFTKAFWWSKRRGIKSYLQYAEGLDVTYSKNEEEDDDQGSSPRIPYVIRAEAPPSSYQEAASRWHQVREDFLSKLHRARQLRAQAQQSYLAVCRAPEIARLAAEAAVALTAAREKLNVAMEREAGASQGYEQAREEERRAVEDRDIINATRPGWFARFFNLRSYRRWNERMNAAIDLVTRTRDEVKSAARRIEQARRELAEVRSQVARAYEEQEKADQALSENRSAISEGQTLMGENFADESFWSRDDQQVQTASPWFFPALQLAQEELFAASFALHRAFIDAAARCLRNNLRAWIEMMKGVVMSSEQEPLRRSLWASLFLVVPVVSTTFASIPRLFRGIGREELGWLLIDEAGQVTPQSAVGALWRAKRTIIIGDPLQLEPVVKPSRQLINAVFSEFGVSPVEWAAPDVSAQSLADRASWFGTAIDSGDGEMWVGSPLRVHRRCQDPMFSISNSMAYGGLMVNATPKGSSEIGEQLRESRWVDVRGGATGKWSDGEGEIVLKLLRYLIKNGVTDPDIYIITPFRNIGFKLRNLIKEDSTIASRIPHNISQWTEERVGTVHTFQGKEADTVVIVLGAQANDAIGARRWAGSKPNLLNVAVTRAKQRLYVVGNHGAWKSAGYFGYLARALPVVSPTEKVPEIISSYDQII
ncbi:MAG TPA: AAA domain-containing protein, partial [Blastocatellia bacterium]|nr:AAA domain-containing protein [Blastocatellia bacterium]